MSHFRTQTSQLQHWLKNKCGVAHAIFVRVVDATNVWLAPQGRHGRCQSLSSAFARASDTGDGDDYEYDSKENRKKQAAGQETGLPFVGICSKNHCPNSLRWS